MKFISHSIVFLVLHVCSTFGCFAAEHDCSQFGNLNIEVARRFESAVAGTVKGTQPVALQSEPQDKCLETAACHVYKRISVVPGSRGVELGREGSWVCVGVASERPLDVWYGWLPTSRWVGDDRKPEILRRWLGVWQNEDAKIKIRFLDAHSLNAQGHALWVGGAFGVSHFGDFEIHAVPADGVLVSSDANEVCQVAVKLTGEFLVVADNDACGGMNVTFSGVYRLRRRL